MHQDKYITFSGNHTRIRPDTPVTSEYETLAITQAHLPPPTKEITTSVVDENNVQAAKDWVDSKET